MSDKQLKRCKNMGICLMAGSPIWTGRRYCASCGRKLKRIQMSDKDYNNLEMRAIEDTPELETSMSSYNRDDYSTKSFPGDFRGKSQTGYQGSGPSATSNNTPPHNGGGHIVPFKPTASDEFTCDPYLEGCPLVKNELRPMVRIPWSVYRRWTFFAKAIKTEWLQYLYGTWDEAEHTWTITGRYTPKQRVNTGHVDVEPNQTRNGPNGEVTIGDIHSHNTMSAFFSAEDKKHFNWPVHLVINAQGEMKANCAVQLECGRQARADADIQWFNDEDEAETEIKDIRGALADPTSSPAQPIAVSGPPSDGGGTNGPQPTAN